MRKRIILLALTGLSVTGCSFTPSQLNADRAHYSGRIVVVRGFVRIDTETHVLCESEALGGEVQKAWAPGNRGSDVKKYGKYCMTIANPELLYRNRATINAKTIVVQGRLIDNQTGKTTDLSACPLTTAIIIDTVALALRYPSLLPQK